MHQWLPVYIEGCGWELWDKFVCVNVFCKFCKFNNTLNAVEYLLVSLDLILLKICDVNKYHKLERFAHRVN